MKPLPMPLPTKTIRGNLLKRVYLCRQTLPMKTITSQANFKAKGGLFTPLKILCGDIFQMQMLDISIVEKPIIFLKWGGCFQSGGASIDIVPFKNCFRSFMSILLKPKQMVGWGDMRIFKKTLWILK